MNDGPVVMSHAAESPTSTLEEAGAAVAPTRANKDTYSGPRTNPQGRGEEMLRDSGPATVHEISLAPSPASSAGCPKSKPAVESPEEGEQGCGKPEQDCVEQSKDMEVAPVDSKSEIERLRELVASFEQEKQRYESELQLKSEMAIVQAKQAHQQALVNLEAELETTLRIQITKELKDAAASSPSAKQGSDELAAKSAALKTALAQIATLNTRLKEVTLRNEELQEKTKIMDTQVRQLANESSEISQLRAKCAELEPKCSKIESELAEAVAERDSLSERLEKESLAHLKTRSDLENRLASATSRQNSALEQIRREAAAERAELENKFSVATAELETSKKLFASRTAEHDAQSVKNSELERELLSLKAEFDAVRAQTSSEAAEALGARGALESELELLKSKITKERQAASLVLKELAAAQTAVNGDSTRSEQLQAQLLETLEELRSFKEKNTALERENDRLSAEVKQCDALFTENDELKIQLSNLRQQRRSLQDELRRIIRSSSSNSLASPSFGALASGTPLTSRGPSISNIFDAIKGSSTSSPSLPAALPTITPAATAPTSSSSQTVRPQAVLDSSSPATAASSPPASATSSVFSQSIKLSSESQTSALSPSEHLIQLDYVRQTMRQFLLRPITRRSLVPVIQKILDCSEDEAKQLNNNFT